jgi:hypothetical protein
MERELWGRDENNDELIELLLVLVEKGYCPTEKPCRDVEKSEVELRVATTGNGEEEEPVVVMLASVLEVLMASCLAPRDNCRPNIMFSPTV